MALTPVLSVAVYDYAYEKLGLSEEFLQARLEKAKIWVPETQKMVYRINQGESFAITAYTGGGKTVMGEWAMIDTQRRTLFLVPTRRLTKRQQRLFKAMGGKLQTRVIMGETPKSQRIWEDLNDRIIFATGHVVVEELANNPDMLKGFDLIGFDEFHNAATEKHPYSIIADQAVIDGIVRFGLSASPGNSEEQIAQTLGNCRLLKKYHIDIPIARQIGSIIHAEEAEVYKKGGQRFIEELIKIEMRRSAFNFNWLSGRYAGVSINLDPEKDVYVSQLKKIRRGIVQFFSNPKEFENHYLFKDERTGGALSSSFREYEVWNYLHTLARKESFEAIDRYYQKTLKSNTSKFAVRMVKRGRIDELMVLIGKALHPKLQLLEIVMQSLVLRRGLQVLIFVDNIATAKAAQVLLERSSIKSALFFGSKHMRPAQQELALEQLEDRDVNCLIATSVAKEGHDFEVDVVVNYGSPKNVISFIQGSGRAGRHEKDAEIIYIATAEERRKIYAQDKAAVRLNQAKMSQFSLGPISEESIQEVPYSEEVRSEETHNEEQEIITSAQSPPVKHVQPNLF